MNRAKTFDAGGRVTEKQMTVPEIPGLIDKKLAGNFQQTDEFERTGILAMSERSRVGPMDIEQLDMSYDSDLNRPIGITGPFGVTYASKATYNGYGALVTHMYGLSDRNKAWSAYYHDEATGRVNKEVFAKEKSNDLDLETTFTRDPALNITKTSTTSRVSSEVDHQCYKRDGLGRMTNAWTPADGNCDTNPAAAPLGGVAPYGLSYGFDASGNMITQADRQTGRSLSWTFPQADQPRPHAPISKQTTTTGAAPRVDQFGYDQSGNTTKFAQDKNIIPDGPGSTASMEYDAEDRVVSSTVDGQKSRFIYGPSGNQIARIDPNKTIVFIGSDTQLELSGGKLTTQRTYTFNGRTVATRTQTEGDKTSKVVATITDTNNTTTWQFDAIANTLVARRTTPYGAPRGAQAPNWQGDKGFVGGTHSPLQGVIRIGDRDYDPDGGRFLQPDRLINTDDPSSWNAYGYGQNDPLGHPDPTGLMPMQNRQMGDFGPRGGLTDLSSMKAANAASPEPVVPTALPPDPFEGWGSVLPERRLSPTQSAAPVSCQAWSVVRGCSPPATYKIDMSDEQANRMLKSIHPHEYTWADAGDWLSKNRGAVATVVATVGCLVPGVGWGLCAVLQAAAFAFRTEQTIAEQGGWDENKEGILIDGALTTVSLGAGAAAKTAVAGGFGSQGHRWWGTIDRTKPSGDWGSAPGFAWTGRRFGEVGQSMYAGGAMYVATGGIAHDGISLTGTKWR